MGILNMGILNILLFKSFPKVYIWRLFYTPSAPFDILFTSWTYIIYRLFWNWQAIEIDLKSPFSNGTFSKKNYFFKNATFYVSKFANKTDANISFQKLNENVNLMQNKTNFAWMFHTF